MVKGNGRSGLISVLGVDVGGTFTDFLLWEQDGDRVQITVHKRPSTPHDPAEAVLAGFDEMGKWPQTLVHGSTVATNAVLERKGAITALITSQGFRDALVIGRQTRPKLYDLMPKRPPPLVPDDLRFEVPERLDHQGKVLVPLDEAAVESVLDRLTALGVESIAVCFLFSFLDPAHERRVAEAARRRSFLVSASSEVLPEYREYERMSTTVLNAYVAPVMGRYLRRLADGLRERGVEHLRIMQSDGGSGVVEAVTRLAVFTLLSGPAGGVAGAFTVARLAGFDHIITLDMGGTSTDVSLCPGRILNRTDATIGDYPVRVPVVDVHTVGAGGGSIARLDAGGALRVGPESAGADPGPACYGRGGQPTVTDAQLVLGRLLPDHFLGGRMRLWEERAEAALATLAGPFGGNMIQAAEAVLRVANSNMERAIRVISVERGYDPRLFTLVAFGGAGPLHACDLAEALRIPRVLIPAFPGVLSAFGMVAADVTKNYSQAVMAPLTTKGAGDDVAARLERIFAALTERARSEMVAEGIAPDTLQYQRGLDLRYSGQSYEITLPVEQLDPDVILPLFHRAHEERYSHSDPDRPVEVVSARLKAVAPAPPIEPPLLEAGTADASGALLGERAVWFGGVQKAKVYDRARLRAGNEVRGPAVIVQLDATTAVPPGWGGRVDRWGNLLLERL